MCGLLEIGLRGVIFAHFFCGRPKKCTFPTAPWPAAAPTTSPAPPAAKTHHLPGTGSYVWAAYYHDYGFTRVKINVCRFCRLVVEMLQLVL